MIHRLTTRPPYNFITNNHRIIYNTYLIFSIFTITCSRIPKIFFSYIWRFLHSDRHLLLFHHWFDFLPSNLHLYLHDICFINAFESFIPVIILNMLRIKYSQTPMQKCNFNKVALQFYWNHSFAWVFSCKFAAYFQNTFS